MLTYRVLHGTAPPCLTSSFTCVADAGSGPHLLTRLMFRFPVGLRSEVVPSLLLEPKCGTVYLEMLHLLRRCRSSGTG